MWLEVLAGMVVVVVLALGYSMYKHTYWSSRGVFTAPRPLPFFGHIIKAMKKESWLYMDELYRKSSGVIGTYQFLQPVLVVADPQLVKAVLVKDFDHFVDRRTIKFSTEQDSFFNELLTVSTGDHWKGIRSVLSPSFTSGRLKSMFLLVEDKADALVAYIKKQTKTDHALKLKGTFSLYTLEVISSCAFGVETNTLANGDSIFNQKVQAISKTTTRGIIKFFCFMMFPWLFRLLKINFSRPETTFFTEVVEETIRRREKGEKRGDFLDIMLEAREEQKNPDAKTPKYKLENKTIVANSFLFILAGYDTTAATMCTVVFQFARYRIYQNRVREEIKDIIKEHGTLTYQGVMEAKLLDAMIQESMRMYPPAHMTERKCIKDYRFPDPGFDLAAETLVGVPIWSLHHDPRYWEAPGTFMPERFLPENKEKITSGTFLPFGLGPRNCIGMRFALMEIKLALAKILLNFELSCVPGEEELKCDPGPGLLRVAPNTRLVFTSLK